MRTLLFVVAFLAAVAATAPLERWALPLLRQPLAASGVDLQLETLRLALPAGLRAGGLDLESAAAGLSVDSLYVGLTRSFEAEACAGRASGSFTRESFDIDWSGVNPSRCLRVGKLELESSLDGSLSLHGSDLLRGRAGSDLRGSLDVTAGSGVFRGLLPHAGRDGSDLPLGEWEFSDLVIHVTLSGAELSVQEGHAVTSGVEWQLLAASFPFSDPRGALRVDFRARQVEDGPRSRALIGLMPRAAEDANGWRSYRVVGSPAAPRVIGIE